MAFKQAEGSGRSQVNSRGEVEDIEESVGAGFYRCQGNGEPAREGINGYYVLHAGAIAPDVLGHHPKLRTLREDPECVQPGG